MVKHITNNRSDFGISLHTYFIKVRNSHISFVLYDPKSKKKCRMNCLIIINYSDLQKMKNFNLLLQFCFK